MRDSKKLAVFFSNHIFNFFSYKKKKENQKIACNHHLMLQNDHVADDDHYQHQKFSKLSIHFFFFDKLVCLFAIEKRQNCYYYVEKKEFFRCLFVCLLIEKMCDNTAIKFIFKKKWIISKIKVKNNNIKMKLTGIMMIGKWEIRKRAVRRKNNNDTIDTIELYKSICGSNRERERLDQNRTEKSIKLSSTIIIIT